MFRGVFQKLNIIEQSQRRLVLRELPLLEWLIVGALVLLSASFAIMSLTVSGLIAIVVAVIFAAQARIRLLVFDADENALHVIFQSPLRQAAANRKPLNQISRAYLHKDDDGSSQIILVQSDGEEFGLSVYSNDMHVWKDDIVIAINAILHEAHQDDL